MNEPIYLYVKGRGWEPSCHHVEITWKGKRYLLINRLPELGEYYVFRAHSPPSRYFIKGTKELDLEKFVGDSSYNVKFRQPTHQLKDWGTYATAVPLD